MSDCTPETVSPPELSEQDRKLLEIFDNHIDDWMIRATIRSDIEFGMGNAEKMRPKFKAAELTSARN